MAPQRRRFQNTPVRIAKTRSGFRFLDYALPQRKVSNSNSIFDQSANIKQSMDQISALLSNIKRRMERCARVESNVKRLLCSLLNPDNHKEPILKLMKNSGRRYPLDRYTNDFPLIMDIGLDRLKSNETNLMGWK